MHHLDMLRRLDALGGGQFAAQLLFQRDLIGLDKGVEPDTGAAVSESHDGGVAHIRVLPDQLDQDGRVTAVYWGRVDTHKNDWAGPESVEPVAKVVAAIHAGDRVYALFPSEHGHLPDRRFIVVDYDNGWETIALDGPPTHEREIHDMDRI
jgi:hypothetical protein